MSINRSVPLIAGQVAFKSTASQNPWRFSYPNSADFNFNYYRLLEQNPDGLGKNQNPDARIAVIGAGIAGILAARELYRSGFRNIDIYEHSERIGGRLWSEPAPDGATSYEMGAMRMPFFEEAGSKNCLLDFYREAFDIEVQDFPNPGSITDTGIYLNEGFGPDMQNPYSEPTLDIWKAEDDQPPAGYLKVYRKFFDWHARWLRVIQEKYNAGEPVWPEYWKKIVNHYWSMNFRDLVFMEAIPEQEWQEQAEQGNFGGLGMTEEESKLFYVMGVGDGGWGAFYDLSALYLIRTIMFGFSTNLQLVKGIADPCICPEIDNTLNNGEGLPKPVFRGMQSFPEAMYYYPVQSWHPKINGTSLHSASSVRLFTNEGVKKITHLHDEREPIRIESTRFNKHTYQHVIMTPQTWAVQRSIEMTGFNHQQWPAEIRSSLKLSHTIASSKVFFPLIARYWEMTKIPQVIVTDTYLQGIYGYAVDANDSSTSKTPGVLLVSYTWEDDSLKLLAENDQELARSCLQTLDTLLARTGYPSICPYIDSGHQPQVFHWSHQPTHRGCAKLYRERTWNDNHQLLRYNQTVSKYSNLYLAGEAYSVEGGWTEPAMRMAMDAVINLLVNTETPFNNFDISNYPQFSDWSPSKIQKIQLVDAETTIL